MAAVVDLDVLRSERAVEAMDDEDLVFVMLGLLSPGLGGQPMAAGCSENAATVARCAFFGIASRWIPPDVFGRAFSRCQEADDA